MAETVMEVACLDAIIAACQRINGAEPYHYALTAVVPHNGLPLEAGTPPLVLVGDPTVRASQDASGLHGEQHRLEVPVMLVAPASGESQADRIRAAGYAWADLRRALRHRVGGAILDVTSPQVIEDMELADIVYQPEDAPDSAWYAVARVTVRLTYFTPYPTTET